MGRPQNKVLIDIQAKIGVLKLYELLVIPTPPETTYSSISTMISRAFNQNPERAGMRIRSFEEGNNIYILRTK